MHFTDVLAIALLAGSSSAHGVVTMIKGANGVDMPGLSVADGTPRDCATPRCGSEADTSIIRDREIQSGRATPLGRTQGAGPVKAETMIAMFMGDATTTGNASAAGATAKREEQLPPVNLRRRQNKILKGLLSGKGGGGGTSTSNADAESNVAAMAGKGASSGLPTCADDGTIDLVFHQVNQDGAGPLTAAVDGTSGGTDAAAFKQAAVTQDVPGIGVGGLSLAAKRDFPVTVKMPAGMTCDATVAGVNNVCIVRVRNSAAAGPFGGSAAFTQSPKARKRALNYRLKKRTQEFRA